MANEGAIKRLIDNFDGEELDAVMASAELEELQATAKGAVMGMLLREQQLADKDAELDKLRATVEAAKLLREEAQVTLGWIRTKMSFSDAPELRKAIDIFDAAISAPAISTKSPNVDMATGHVGSIEVCEWTHCADGHFICGCTNQMDALHWKAGQGMICDNCGKKIVVKKKKE
jgi:DNA-directed RNA polymerase subunit RPC12/RpoP